MSQTKETSDWIKYLKKHCAGYIFILPVVLGILLFTIYPMIESLITSFKKYDGFNQNEWVGFYNYRYMFTFDWTRGLQKAFSVTFIFTLINVPLCMILSYALALFLNKKIKGIKFFRLFYYLPVIIPLVVSSFIWKNVFDPNFGIANAFLRAVNLPESKFFMAAQSSMPTVIFMSMWGLGGGMILWIAAFKNIPESLIEAAKIDGANAFLRLYKIIIPMTTPMIFFNLVTGIITSLQTYGTMIMVGGAGGGGGGVDDSLLFLAVKIYETAFISTRMGYAAAISWILFIIIAVMTMIIFKFSNWVYYGEDSA